MDAREAINILNKEIRELQGIINSLAGESLGVDLYKTIRRFDEVRQFLGRDL